MSELLTKSTKENEMIYQPPNDRELRFCEWLKSRGQDFPEVQAVCYLRSFGGYFRLAELHLKADRDGVKAELGLI